MNNKFRLFLLVLVLLFVLPILAQEDTSLPPIAGVTAGGDLVVFNGEDTQVIAEVIGPDYRFYRGVWNSAGAHLAYMIAPDSNNILTRSIMVWNGEESIELVTNTENKLANALPLNWTLDGSQILYAEYVSDPTQPRDSFDAPINIFTIEPIEGSEPQLIGEISVSEGCGGGSNYPSDWAFWE